MYSQWSQQWADFYCLLGRFTDMESSVMAYVMIKNKDFSMVRCMGLLSTLSAYETIRFQKQIKIVQ